METYAYCVRKQLIETGKKMYQRGLIIATEGNISCRQKDGTILATASGVCKGEMQEADVVRIDTAGRVLAGDRLPSTEIKMHLEVYRQRPDVGAVVHAHPPYVVALSLIGFGWKKAYMPESAIMLGAVPVAPYARPSTGQVPESIREPIRQSDIVILERHGSLTVGQTLEEAYQKLEILEHTARVIWLALQVGQPEPLPPEEIEALMKLRETVYGLKYPIIHFSASERSDQTS